MSDTLAREMTQSEHDIVELETRLRAAQQRGGPVTLPHDMAIRLLNVAREREHLRHYRDRNEARTRGEPDITDATPLRQSDADHMRILASYGSRVCRSTWFYALAARIEATLAEGDSLTDTDRSMPDATRELASKCITHLARIVHIASAVEAGESPASDAETLRDAVMTLRRYIDDTRPPVVRKAAGGIDTRVTPRNWNFYAVWEKNHAIMICHAVDGDNCIRGFDTVEEAELALKALQSPGVTEATDDPKWQCPACGGTTGVTGSTAGNGIGSCLDCGQLVDGVTPDERPTAFEANAPQCESVRRSRCWLPRGHDGDHRSGILTWSTVMPDVTEATAEPRGLVFPLQCSARRLARLAEDSPDRDDRDQLYEYSAVCDDAAALLARCESEREPDAWEWNRKSEHGFHHECPNQSHVTLREISIDARDKDTTIYHYGCKQCGSFWHERVMLRACAPVAQPEPREPDAARKAKLNKMWPEVVPTQPAPVPVTSPPTMTDLMVTPESLSGYDGASPELEAKAAWVRGCDCDAPWKIDDILPNRCLKCGAWWAAVPEAAAPTPAPDAEWTRDESDEWFHLRESLRACGFGVGSASVAREADAYVSRLHAKVAELERASAEPDLGGFVIWSGEHGAWWRTHRSGYTQHLLAAGVYTNEEAVAATRHCGPEKRIEIQPLSEQYGLVSLDGTVAARLLERATVAPDTRDTVHMECGWSFSNAGSFRCILPYGHKGLHHVAFGENEHEQPKVMAPDTRDTERLDFLDQCKGWHNAHDGYVLLHLGWYKDSPAKTIREAIDEAMRDRAERFEEDSHHETAAILRDAAALLARCGSEREPDAVVRANDARPIAIAREVVLFGEESEARRQWRSGNPDFVPVYFGGPVNATPVPAPAAQWQCQGCGEMFDVEQTSHAVHDPKCDGSCRYCPSECGPIVKVPSAEEATP